MKRKGEKKKETKLNGAGRGGYETNPTRAKLGRSEDSEDDDMSIHVECRCQAEHVAHSAKLHPPPT
jgi:hypothetical protein